MSQSTISIRVESSIKEKFDAMCEAFGLTTSAALNIFMKTVIRERRIPFEIRVDNEAERLSKRLQAIESLRASAIEKGLADMTLDEINAEIKASRDERRTGDLRRH